MSGSSTTVFGIDIASYQAGMSLSEVAGEGFAFCYAKATQGVTYVDPDYAGWAAVPGTLRLIPYHYATTDAPGAQAAFHHSVVGSVPATMLDVETGGPSTAAGVLALIRAFAVPFVVDLYLPHWRWVELGSPDMSAWPIRNLIASDYPSSAPGYASALYPGDNFDGWNDYGGRGPDVLQFTDAARVDGRLVDADAARSIAVFDLPGGSGAPAPPAPPAPTVPPGWAAPVAVIQRELNRWPFSPLLAEDGKDGPLTQAAVRKFQAAAGISDDGVAGPDTYRHVTSWYGPSRPQLAAGSSGPAVRTLQAGLNAAVGGIPLAVDGRFGSLTEAKVKAFQQRRALEVDGVAGRETNAAVQV